jgi:hypothetical protein
MNTGEVVELFDGGWLELAEGLPQVRVIVARHPAPLPDKDVKIGKRVGKRRRTALTRRARFVASYPRLRLSSESLASWEPHAGWM